MKTELYINGTRVNLSQEVNASLNYAIADIREPEKRNGAFSRSVKLYCDSVLSQVLDAIFEIGYNTQTSGIVNFMPDFNPNLKAPFVLYADGMEQLRGYMRLRSIDRDEQGLQRMYYNVELYGMLANIFTDLGDKKMGELDYSSDNHIYNRTNQKATWTNVDADDGNYVYPMINYGTVPSENTWKVTDFFPSISLKSLVDKIVTGVGYQYDSTFFDSSYFKKQYITFTGDKLTLSASGVANSLFSARTNVALSGNAIASTTDFPFNVEVSDPSNQYDNTTYTFTAASAGWHEFVITGNVGFINITSSTLSTALSANLYFVCLVNNTTPYLTTQTGNLSYGNLASWAFATNNVTFTSQSILLNAGDIVVFRLQPFLNNNLSNVKTYAASGITVKNTRNNPAVVEGGTIEMNAALPVDVRQADFFKWLILRYNLMVEPDKTNDKKIYVETANDFYASGTPVDWTTKVDVSKPVTITPMGLLDAIRYVVKDADDNDYRNKFYKDKWGKTYGQKELDVTNDFIKNTKVIETGFAPAVLVGSTAHDRIIPHIYQSDSNGVRTPMKSKMRIVYWSGTFNTSSAWTYQTATSGYTETTYPYAGHVDNPYTPTLDVNVFFPREIYYTNPQGATQYTDNNVYNAYHKLYMDEITNANSKLVTLYAWLRPIDILQLSFKNIVHIDGHNYRLHKVVDFDPLQEKSTKIELLKLITGIPFTPETKSLDFTYGGQLGGLPAPSFNWNGDVGGTAVVSNATNTGRGNYVAEDSTGTTVGGEGNRVGAGTSNITILGSDNVSVASGLTNVTVINSDNLNITESDVIYIDGVKQQAPTTTTLTGNTTITEAGYYLANGTFTITLSPSDYPAGTRIDIKDITSGAHTITISGGGVNIDGAATYTLTVTYESVTIFYNGTQFYLL